MLEGALPEKIMKAAELYVGCVSGAIQKRDYLDIIIEAGFKNIAILKEKKIVIPEEILLQYISNEELEDLKQSGLGVYSITVYADKPAKDERNCCEPGSGCC